MGAGRATGGRHQTFVHSISGPCYIENTAHNRAHSKYQIWNSTTRFLYLNRLGTNARKNYNYTLCFIQ
jgi:hypothetical protein